MSQRSQRLLGPSQKRTNGAQKPDCPPDMKAKNLAASARGCSLEFPPKTCQENKSFSREARATALPFHVAPLGVGFGALEILAMSFSSFQYLNAVLQRVKPWMSGDRCVA